MELSILLNLLELGALICLAKPLLLLEGEPRCLARVDDPKRAKDNFSRCFFPQPLVDGSSSSRFKTTADCAAPELRHISTIPTLRKTQACISCQLATLSGTRQSEPKDQQSHRYTGNRITINLYVNLLPVSSLPETPASIPELAYCSLSCHGTFRYCTSLPSPKHVFTCTCWILYASRRDILQKVSCRTRYCTDSGCDLYLAKSCVLPICSSPLLLFFLLA